jgi:hypothetical protein
VHGSFDLSDRDFINIPYATDTRLYLIYFNLCMATGYNPKPLKNCSQKCGNISVPFPFGLEEGCSARKLFQLNCSDTTYSVLKYNDNILVTFINVNEGLVGFKIDPDNAEWEFNFQMELVLAFSREPDLFVNPLESPASVQWAVANLTCQVAQQNTSGYACVSINSTCISVLSSAEGYVGYRCQCLPGFEGNPYIQDGCHGILPPRPPLLPKPPLCNGN